MTITPRDWHDIATDIGLFDKVAADFGELTGTALNGNRISKNYVLDQGNIRSTAVASVDGCHGYTCEFSPCPAQHISEYDTLEELLTAALPEPPEPTDAA